MSASPIQFRPINKRDFQILRRLNSPVWQRIQLGLTDQQTSANATPVTATEAAELVFQFSHPIREVEKLLQQGRAHFRFAAAKAVTVADENEAKALLDRIQTAIVRFGNSSGKDTAI